MMKEPFLLFLLVVLVTGSIGAQQPNWFRRLREIKLLEATKSDTSQLFGQPESTSAYFETFRTKAAKISVEYSKAGCTGKTDEGWDVPELTITRIFVAPVRGVSPRQLGIDTKRFSKHEIADVPGAFDYDSEEDGINFDVKRNGKIESLVLYPPRRLDHLRCKVK